MVFSSSLRRWVRRTLSSVLIATSSFASADANFAWREAKTLNDLVFTLETWLDGNAPWPKAEKRPEIRWISASEAASLHTPQFLGSGSPRGLYEADTATVYLVQPWDRRDPRDVAVLLHELAHHRQAGAQHWVCPGAMELSAYRLQNAWLSELGLSANVNWIAVVLEAGCGPRDVHPD